MQRLLCTIGFAGKTAEEFFGLLLQAGVEKLIDIRQNRAGQLSGFAKHPDLAYFLREVAKIDYSHEPLLAPPTELLKEYRKAKDWPAYESAFLAVMKERGVPEKIDTTSWPSKVALLCSEPVRKSATAAWWPIFLSRTGAIEVSLLKSAILSPNPKSL
jgi:Protein of unknown function, DUF488